MPFVPFGAAKPKPTEPPPVEQPTPSPPSPRPAPEARPAASPPAPTPTPTPAPPRLKAPPIVPQPKPAPSAAPPVATADADLSVRVRQRNMERSGRGPGVTIVDEGRPSNLGSSLGTFTAPTPPKGAHPDTTRMAEEGLQALDKRDLSSIRAMQETGELAARGAELVGEVARGPSVGGLLAGVERMKKPAAARDAAAQEASVNDALAQVLRDRLSSAAKGYVVGKKPKEK